MFYTDPVTEVNENMNALSSVNSFVTSDASLEHDDKLRLMQSVLADDFEVEISFYDPENFPMPLNVVKAEKTTESVNASENMAQQLVKTNETSAAFGDPLFGNLIFENQVSFT